MNLPAETFGRVERIAKHLGLRGPWKQLGRHAVHDRAAERSIAVDSGLYPYGTPVWVESDLPESKAFIERQYNRLFIAQDAGGAIRGAVRGDVFFGRGKKAEKVAHSFKAKTNFYLLFPKTVDVPEAYKSF